MNDISHFEKNNFNFLYAKKLNENWKRDNKIIYLHFNYNLGFNNLAQEFGLTKERIRQILIKFISSFNKKEKNNFFIDFYVRRNKFKFISKFFKIECNFYKKQLEQEIEDISFKFSYNNNFFKIVKKSLILKSNARYFLKSNNYFKLNILDFKDNLILPFWKQFEFKDIITRKDKVDIIAKAYFKPYTKYKIEEIISIYKQYFPKLSRRAIEGMLFNYNEIFSLSAGKYMISYYKDQKEFLYFSYIADLIYEKVNNFFLNDDNIICDISKFKEKNNFNYPFLNEHHYYFFAKKYSEKFNNKFDSFRSPIIFKKEQKAKISGKDIQLLFKKQIEMFLEENDLYNKWINKDLFLKNIHDEYGIKDYYFFQKMHLFNLNKISGNRYEKGKIKFNKDY
ncbi:MAG: hypothetical protein HPPSJP_0700 [Candidatus Hepatoplasma scabrum]|nr:MAG: hypothetical protein HPPSJP_0700 [Candidatus Hepatoplasma sp.]